MKLDVVGRVLGGEEEDELMLINYLGENEKERKKIGETNNAKGYWGGFQFGSMNASVSRLRLLACALMVKLFFFVHCCSLRTTSA